MAKNHNLAFDYSIYDNQVEEINGTKAIKHNRNLLTAVNKKSNIITIIGSVLILALLSAMIYGRVELSSLYTQRTELETQLAQLQSENVSLESELAQKTSMTKVEEYAEKELGLQKLDKSQIEYVEVENDNTAQIVKSDDSNIFVKIKRWFSSVLEYIGL